MVLMLIMVKLMVLMLMVVKLMVVKLMVLMLMVVKLIGRSWIFIEFLLFDGHSPIFHRHLLSGLGNTVCQLT